MRFVADASHFLRVLGTLLLATGLLALGAMCVVDPHSAAEMFGLPLTSDGDVRWVAVAGARDAAIGAGTLALHFSEPRVMRVFAPTLLLLVRRSPRIQECAELLPHLLLFRSCRRSRCATLCLR